MAHNSQKNEEVEEEKLEDILRSIRGIIDNHNQSTNRVKETSPTNNNSYEEEQVLELTIQAENNNENINGLVSNEVISKSVELMKDFASKRDKAFNQSDNLNADKIIINLVKPILKEWLDNNLQRLVEKIIIEELRRLSPQKIS